MKIRETCLHFPFLNVQKYITNCLIKGFVLRCTAPVNPNNNYFKTVFFLLLFFCAFDCWRVLTGFQTACLGLTFSSFVSFFHNFFAIKILPKHSHNVSSYRFKLLCITVCFCPFILSRALSAIASIFTPTLRVPTNTRE